MKKAICLILCICLLCVPVSAAGSTKTAENKGNTVVGAPEVKAKSCILMEVETGQILFENNADERLAPASITKVMSLLLVMEALERGDIKLDTIITASEHACSMGGSQIWLEPGEQMSVDELLKATVIASANDATVALGEQLAGSEEGFVALMNKRAKELGMNNTNFINCTGLDAEGHLTTAHDVAVMSAALIRHELIKKYSTVWMDSLRNGESELTNTNKLVRFYEGCTGLKTGTTSTAGYCLSATAKRDGMELVAVVMDGQTSNDRFEGAKKLLNFGFANFGFSKVKADLGERTHINVDKGVESEIPISAEGGFNILLPKTAKGEIKQQISLPDSIAAPIKKGDTVGKVTLSVDGEQIGVINIKADEGCDRLNITHTFVWLLKALFYL